LIQPKWSSRLDRYRTASAATSSFWFATEMYSPVAIDTAPATSPARPVRIRADRARPPPPTPAIKEPFVFGAVDGPKDDGAELAAGDVAVLVVPAGP